jgi:hypothetical protein
MPDSTSSSISGPPDGPGRADGPGRRSGPGERNFNPESAPALPNPHGLTATSRSDGHTRTRADPARALRVKCAAAPAGQLQRQAAEPLKLQSLARRLGYTGSRPPLSRITGTRAKSALPSAPLLTPPPARPRGCAARAPGGLPASRRRLEAAAAAESQGPAGRASRRQKRWTEAGPRPQAVSPLP